MSALLAVIPSSVIRYSRLRPVPRASSQPFCSRPLTVADAGGSSRPFTQPRPRSSCINCRSLCFGRLITGPTKSQPVQASTLMTRKSSRRPEIEARSAPRSCLLTVGNAFEPARTATSASLIELRISRRSNRVDDGSARNCQALRSHSLSTRTSWSKLSDIWPPPLHPRVICRVWLATAGPACRFRRFLSESMGLHG
jgi:hypothetical protein